MAPILPPLFALNSMTKHSEDGGGQESAKIRMDGDREEERDDAVQQPSKSKKSGGQSGFGTSSEAPTRKQSAADDEDDEESQHASKEMEKKAKSARADPKKKAKLIKEMHHMRRAARCFPMLLELGLKPDKASEKVEEELSALSVVSALLTIVTFSLLTAVPPEMDLEKHLPQKRAYGVITATALVCNFASLVLATLLKKSMNCLINQGGVARQYVMRFSSDLTEICSFAFTLGVLLMLASILIYIYFKYTEIECYIMIAITGASVLAVIGVYLVPHRLMVAAIKQQFDIKMAKLMEETPPYDQNTIWRRIWNHGWAGFLPSSGDKTKVHAADSPV